MACLGLEFNTNMGDSFPANFRDFIVSTESHVTFLHRCFSDSLDSILREGLSSWCESLSGTATLAPRDISEAENLYRIGLDHGNKAVVVMFPKDLYQKRIRGQDLTTKELAYFHPTRSKFTVRPEFVVGAIDRNSDEYTPNPHFDRKPAEG